MNYMYVLYSITQSPILMTFCLCLSTFPLVYLFPFSWYNFLCKNSLGLFGKDFSFVSSGISSSTSILLYIYKNQIVIWEWPAKEKSRWRRRQKVLVDFVFHLIWLLFWDFCLYYCLLLCFFCVIFTFCLKVC